MPWSTAIVLSALSMVLLCGAGCASHPQTDGSSIESIERPARPIEEEETLSDKIGETGVAVLVVGVALAIIIVPIILLGGLF